jgi:hypothetical protein
MLAPAVHTRGILERPILVAMVETGPAVIRIIDEIDAGIAMIAASAQPSGIVVALPTGREAIGLLIPVTALAVDFAGVGLRSRPGRLQSHRTQKGTGKNGTEVTQRFPAGK